MRLFRRPEVVLNTQMHFRRTRTEPRAAARCEIGWFRAFSETEYANIKRPRVIFSPARHRELHIVQSKHGHLPAFYAVSIVTMPRTRAMGARRASRSSSECYVCKGSIRGSGCPTSHCSRRQAVRWLGAEAPLSSRDSRRHAACRRSPPSSR